MHGIFLSLTAASALATAQSVPGWNLLWADEFSQVDGTKPDSSKWGYDRGGSGWGNNELQSYTDRIQNARIENGHLVIEAREENSDGRNFTSARLLTKGKAAWTYGRIEARIRIPKGRGIWPAFWMLGANIDSVGWPNCGEIDILENIGSLPSTLYGTLHGPGYSGANGVSGNTVLAGAALGDDFHIYAIEWEENRIRWFLDGQPFFTLTPANLPNGSSWVFNQPQFLILNVAVGGNWPGSPDASTSFPQRMTVDYVRVYQRPPVVPADVSVTFDPAENWLGYMHVSDLQADGGDYRFGAGWSPADLRAVFSGAAVTLSATPIADPDPYWFVGGGAPGAPGNKVMGANLYVEKTGSLSGKTVTFSGRVSATSLTAAHRSVAFIKDFSADYASFRSVTVPLTQGAFSISLPTIAGADRHVQYGFETTGVNVWPTDTGPLGAVSIEPFIGRPFDAWIANHDFAAFANPDLTRSGDPDGDGQSNWAEFALDGDPRSSQASGKLRSRLEVGDGGRTLVLTFPVRGTPIFAGGIEKTGTSDGVIYTVEGSNGLTDFDQVVHEVPASAAGMPLLNSGWNYRSFRLDGWVDGSAPRGPSGFLRVRTGTAP